MKHIHTSLLCILSFFGLGTTIAQVLGEPTALAQRPPSEIYQALQQLEKTDLSALNASDVEAIPIAIVQEKTPYRNRFFLLAGWLGQLDALQAVPYEYRRHTRFSNDYDLAMIRAGDPNRIERLKRLLTEVQVDDDFVYQLAPKLLYTHRREVVDFFFNEILQDKNNCAVADAHSSGQINCAYRLLELMAPMIQGFPLKVGVSGDLEVEDYPTALATARAWIQEHRTDYLLKTGY